MGPSNKKKHSKSKPAAFTSLHTNLTVDMPVDTATTVEIASRDDTSSVTHTRIAFSEFIELADLSAIKMFIITAASSSEGKNLKLLWARAFKEGLISGHQLYGKTEEKLKETHANGYEEGFQAGYNEGRRDEYGDWSSDGHGMHCGYQDPIPYDDYGTQTNPTARPIINTAAVSTQTDSIISTISATLSTQTESPAPTLDATSQTEPALIKNGGKNSKIGSTSEMLPNIIDFSSSTPSSTSIDSPAPSTVTTGLETQFTLANFDQKLEKLEKPPISNKITSKTPTPNISEPTDNIARAYASPPTPNDVVLQPQSAPATTITASSSQLPAGTTDGKSALLRAAFESQASMESTAPTSVVTALETRPELDDSVKIHQKVEKAAVFTQRTPEPIVLGQSECADNVSVPPTPTAVAKDLKTLSETAGSIRNNQKVEKSPIFTQKGSPALVSGDLKLEDDDDLLTEPITIAPALETHATTAGFIENIEKSPVLDNFRWSDEAESLPSPSTTTPTKHPRDFSGLRSSLLNPFSSLRRRRHNRNRNLRQFFNSWSQSCCQHTFPISRYHSSTPHVLPYNISQPPASVSLNWDQDPRLFDLGNALRALGWVRR
jgi:hypothetical protein